MSTSPSVSELANWINSFAKEMITLAPINRADCDVVLETNLEYEKHQNEKHNGGLKTEIT
jgi:hypothetical protein